MRSEILTLTAKDHNRLIISGNGDNIIHLTRQKVVQVLYDENYTSSSHLVVELKRLPIDIFDAYSDVWYVKDNANLGVRL